MTDPQYIEPQMFEPPDGAPEALSQAYWAGRTFIHPGDAAGHWEQACEMFAAAFPEAPGNSDMPNLAEGPPVDPAQASCPRGFIQLRLAMLGCEIPWLVSAVHIVRVNPCPEMPECCDMALSTHDDSFTVFETFEHVKRLMREAIARVSR